MLRHCATSRMVAGSIPGGDIGIFHWPSRTLALGWTQPVTEISTRNISWRVKAALPPSCANCLEIWEPLPQGTFGAGPGLSRGWLKKLIHEVHWLEFVFCTLNVWLQLSHHITTSKYSSIDGFDFTCSCGSRITRICYCSLCNWFFGNKYLRSHTKKR